jgi:hypothetical protein
MEKREELEPMASVGSITPPIFYAVRRRSFLSTLSHGAAFGSSMAVVINPSPCGLLEQRPDVCAPMAANLTGKSRLQIGQADVIAPAAGVHYD